MMVRTGTHAAHRRGFTIIETALAMVIGGLVLVGCVSVFIASSRAEKAFSQRYERTGELWTTQLAVRRTFLNLLVEERTTSTPAGAGVTSEEELPRPRVILEPDPGAPQSLNGSRPQRLEVTVGRSPVPSILGSQTGTWLVEQDRADSLDFASTSLSSGAIRGVYELRPSGQRETLMMSLGLMDPDRALIERMQNDPPPGWTLWWRPILSTELAELESGLPPRSDQSGDAATLQNRLAGAIPVLRGVDSLRWTIFKSDERVDAYAAAGVTDLPAFAELEILLVNGRYANWMFEIGWDTGTDPTNDNDSGSPDADGGGGGGDNDSPGGTRPPGNPGQGGIRGVGGRTNNLGGRDN